MLEPGHLFRSRRRCCCAPARRRLRAYSFFGAASSYVIFSEERTDLLFGRASLVLEYLNPGGRAAYRRKRRASRQLAPNATGVRMGSMNMARSDLTGAAGSFPPSCVPPGLVPALVTPKACGPFAEVTAKSSGGGGGGGKHIMSCFDPIKASLPSGLPHAQAVEAIGRAIRRRGRNRFLEMGEGRILIRASWPNL